MLGWKFVPGMWALANDPFFPQPWKTIAILCGLYTMFQPALLFWVLGKSGEKALEAKLKEGFDAWKKEQLTMIGTAKQALKAEADSRRAAIEKSLIDGGNLTRLVNIITLRQL